MSLQNLNTAIYPTASPDIEMDAAQLAEQKLRVVGLCFSGGGSRALSATMGQLRGLSQAPATGKTPWIDQVGSISSVSGGCWASSIYVYLPMTISYTDFLNSPAEPSQLTWDGDPLPSTLAYLPPNNLGWVPTRLSWEAFFEQIKSFMDAKFDDAHQWWRAAIGNLVFRDFGLYDTDANYNPTKYFAWQEFYFDRETKPYNNNLSYSDFHFTRNYWPWLTMNAAMFYKDFANKEELIPYFSTSRQGGILAEFPQANQSGPIVGGGTVQTFANGSTFVSKDGVNRAKISQQRPFSLVDIAALSSSAFAAEFEKRYALGDLVPQYQYWSPQKGGSASQTYDFADGGNLENSGLATMLATTELKKIVVFINSSEAVQHDLETSEFTQVPATIPPLFGYQPIAGVLDFDGYKLYQGDANPASPLRKHNQVFCSSDFQALLDGLKNNSDNFKNTAMFYQPNLQVQENSWFGVKGNRKVDVLWVCNNKVKSWEDAITDPKIRLALDLRDVFESDLWQFPYYSTLGQIHLSAEQVNMLAHLSCWNVTTQKNRPMWEQIFGSS